MIAQLLLVLSAVFSQMDPAAALARVDAMTPAVIAIQVELELDDPRTAVQVELVADPEAAETFAAALRTRLEDRGLAVPVFVETVHADFDMPPAFRIGLGPFADFEDAERARSGLSDIGVSSFVRELDPMIGC